MRSLLRRTPTFSLLLSLLAVLTVAVGLGSTVASPEAGAATPTTGRFILRMASDNYQSEFTTSGSWDVHEGSPTGPVVWEASLLPGWGYTGFGPELDPGSYFVVETETPNNHRPMTGPVEVVVTAGADQDVYLSYEALATSYLNVSVLGNNGTTTEQIADVDYIVERFDHNAAQWVQVGTGTSTDFNVTNFGPFLGGWFRVTAVGTAPSPWALPGSNTTDVGSGQEPSGGVYTGEITLTAQLPTISTMVANEPYEDDGGQARTAQVIPGDEILEAGPGQEIYEQVTVGGIADFATGSITVEAYGPFATPPNSDSCTTGNFIESLTSDYNGRFDSETLNFPFTFDDPGYYTFVATWNGDDTSTATHPCGLAEETVRVLGDIIVTTTTTSTTTTSTTVPESTTSTTSTTVPESTTPTTGTPVTVFPGEPVYLTCEEVFAAGLSNLTPGEYGYSEHLDRDGDGIACERNVPSPTNPPVDPVAVPTPTPTQTPDLPRTGSNSGPLAGIGLSLLAVGGVLMFARRRASSNI